MPSVSFERTVTVSTEPATVWEVVTDVSRVAGWVSVVGSVVEVEALRRYTSVLTDQLGPFRLSADLEVGVTSLADGESIRFLAEGEDRQVASRIRIEAGLTLRPEGDLTAVDVDGTYEVTGRVASLGGSMIRSKGDKILDQFFAALEAELG